MNRRSLLKIIATGTASIAIPNFSKANDCLTSTDILGPYYKQHQWFTEDMSINEPGSILFITGTIYANDCISIIPNATVDVWHADTNGAYHDNKFRTKVKTDENGHYSYKTILPGKYLNGNSYRPRHIHIKVHLNGNDHLTTQTYFQGDVDIPKDPWASNLNAENRTIVLTQDDNEAYHGVNDFSINIEPTAITSIQDNVLNQISITSSGNKENTFIINSFAYSGNINISILTMNGKLVSEIKDIQMNTNETKNISLIDKNGISFLTGIYIVKITSSDNKTLTKRIFL